MSCFMYLPAFNTNLNLLAFMNRWRNNEILDLGGDLQCSPSITITAAVEKSKLTLSVKLYV